MTPFMTEDFLLDSEFARRLYHDYAKDQPIFDYHCHLPPQQVAENYRFKNLYDIWPVSYTHLDVYKRQMEMMPVGLMVLWLR